MDSQSNRQRFVDRHLDPASRLGEVLFGLIMVLTVTLTAGASVAEGETKERQLLWAAIGCNIAWGIIDAVMYIMNCLTERSRQVRLARMIQDSASPEAAVAIVRTELEPEFEALAPRGDREAFYGSIAKSAAEMPLARTRVARDDVLGGVACFWLVFISCLPASLPFLIFRDSHFALRVSNFLLIGLLFFIGQKWAQYAQTNRWVSGLAMVLLALALVGVAILLGG